jgi:hypothetical protein
MKIKAMKIIQPKTNAASGTALRNSNPVRAVEGGELPWAGKRSGQMPVNLVRA